VPPPALRSSSEAILKSLLLDRITGLAGFQGNLVDPVKNKDRREVASVFSLESYRVFGVFRGTLSSLSFARAIHATHACHAGKFRV